MDYSGTTEEVLTSSVVDKFYQVDTTDDDNVFVDNMPHYLLENHT